MAASSYGRRALHGVRVVVGFRQTKRNGGSDFLKAAASNGRVKWTAVRRLFFFCRRPAKLTDIFFLVLQFSRTEFLRYVLEFALSANPTISFLAKLLYHHRESASV